MGPEGVDSIATTTMVLTTANTANAMVADTGKGTAMVVVEGTMIMKTTMTTKAKIGTEAITKKNTTMSPNTKKRTIHTMSPNTKNTKASMIRKLLSSIGDAQLVN